MGPIAKKFVSRSLMLALFLSLGYLALPASAAAQGVMLEQRVKEDSRVLQQRQREAARAREQVKRQQLLARDFAMLMAKAKAQQVMIEQWQKAHSKESKTQAKDGVHKKR